MLNLKDMQRTDVRAVDPDSLVDIKTVSIDHTLPHEERLRAFVEQIGNPYCYKCGSMVVKISFSENEPTLEERLKAYLKGVE